MKKLRSLYIFTIVSCLLLLVLSLLLQTYRFTALEEEYIFLYDWQYMADVAIVPGGVARLIGSWLSQFFIFRYAGAVITSVVYAVSVFVLSSLAVYRRCPAFMGAVASVPCLCLLLCIENSAFEYQGVISISFCCLAFALYARMRCRGYLFYVIGFIAVALLYWLVGPAVLAFVIAAVIFDIFSSRPSSYLSISYILAFAFSAWCAYRFSFLNTTLEAFTPAMYYDMGSTFFMMIYAMCSLPIFALFVVLFANRGERTSMLSQWLWGAGTLVAVFALCLNIYTKVHSVSNYEIDRQRYLARHQLWDDIINTPYQGETTPYTSYRFLALAHMGRLDSELANYRPYISYIFENKPKVKKRDQQVYSDIYYDCIYLPAARRAAFDTDIVTPGAFNPYETQKLAAINMAFGDYAVADKLLAKLEKTRFYRKWASEHRAMLYDDALLLADSSLSQMRRAISPENFYLSPKGIQRDLGLIADSVPECLVARQFYNAFLILTQR